MAAGDDIVTARAHMSTAVKEFAIDDVFTEASEHEDAIYAAIRQVAASIGAELAGEKRRRKERDSLSRKITNERADVDAASSRSLAWTSIAGNIRDALRLTTPLPFNGFVDAYNRAVAALTNAGLVLRHVKNTFPNDTSSYRGINTVLVDDVTNYEFEPQFHTAKSYDVKENGTHKYYEVVRDPSKRGTPEYDEASRKQAEMFDSIPIPEGVESIRSF